MAKKPLLSSAMRWHSRVGVALFWLLIALSLSGIALNHTDRLGLAKISLDHSLVRHWYGLAEPSEQPLTLHQRHYQLSAHRSGDTTVGTLVHGGQRVASCTPPIHSALELSNQLAAVLCAQELILLHRDGQLFDIWQPLTGLPTGLVALEKLDTQLIGRTGDGRLWLLDVEQFTATATATTATTDPANEFVAVAADQASSVSLQTLLLDLHSGRLFGRAGIWVVDIAGVLFCLLALTGLWGFIRRPR